MNVKYINPFLSAVKNVFETMIDVPFRIGKPALKKEGLTPYEISGIIGITGDITGCVTVSFSESVALGLASALLDEKITQVDEDCKDAIGEIANMLAGDAKKGFPEGNTSVSVPSIIIGKHEVAYPRGVPIIFIPCETDDGKFAIEVALKVP
ncbi:MAG: chemotaxis protein CheX [Desulfobacteraceae bacterium]|nr:chemotaxis protein CheX [Desulfobacteraceae bacterium]